MPSTTFRGSIKTAVYTGITLYSGSQIPSGATINSVRASLSASPGKSATITISSYQSGVASYKIGTFTVSSSSYTNKSVTKYNFSLLSGKSTIYIYPSVALNSYVTVTITVNYTASSSTLTWSSGASLSVTQTEAGKISVTKSGTATHSGGSTVTYYLYDGSTSLGTLTSTGQTFSNITTGSHTFKVVASAGGLTANGPTKTISIVIPTLTWSNATLSVQQTNLYDPAIRCIWSGSPYCNLNVSMKYRIDMDDETIGSDLSSTSFLYSTHNLGTHTFKVYVSAAGLTTLGTTTTFTITAKSATIKYYDGNDFIECEMYRYTDGEFVKVIPYFYNGTQWILCSHS